MKTETRQTVNREMVETLEGRINKHLLETEWQDKYEEDLESLSGWYDPAGGWHSNNEDDPAAMYE